MAENDDARRSWVGWMVGAALVLALAVVGYNYFSGANTVVPAEERLNDLADNPSDFYGETVSVTGTVDTVIGAQAFELDAPGAGFEGDDVLIVSRQSLVPIGGGGDDYLYNPNDRVSVSGQVQQFNLRQIETDLGVDLIDEDFADWQGKPVIIANSVSIDR